MGGEWEWKPLAALSVNHDARRLPVKESDRRSGEYPYYGASGIVDYVDGYLFDGEYLLVAEDGENLRTRQTPVAFIARGRFWVNNHAHVIEANSENLTRYLSYALQQTDITAYLTGAVMPKLTQANLNRILLPAPPLRAQRYIDELLGSLDDKIELNRRMAETLEGIARAIFKSWFVDFDPVRAKVERRPTGLPDGLVALFPDRFGDDGVPARWDQKPLTEFLSIIGGGTPKTSIPDYWSGRIPWFSVTDTPPAGSVFVVATEKTITEQGLHESSARLVPKGTTIISARGTVGNLAVAGQDMTFNQSCYGLRGNGAVGDWFTYLAAQKMVGQLQSRAHGSVFATITRQTFDSVTLPKADDAVLRGFEVVTTPLFDRVLVSVRQSHSLAALRDTLLPKLISGELRIADAERRIAAA